MIRNRLTDAEWKNIEQLLPADFHERQDGRPPKDNRMMVDAMYYIIRTGCPWRDMPAEFGPWSSVYTRFRRWTQAGIWQQVIDKLSQKADHRKHMIDSTTIRAHQHAAGASSKKGGRKIRH